METKHSSRRYWPFVRGLAATALPRSPCPPFPFRLEVRITSAAAGPVLAARCPPGAEHDWVGGLGLGGRSGAGFRDAVSTLLTQATGFIADSPHPAAYI